MSRKKLLLLINLFRFSFLIFPNSFDDSNLVLIRENQYTVFHDVEFSKNVIEKINPINQKVLDCLKTIDNNDTYSNHLLTENEKKMFLEYFEMMPKSLQETFINKVYTIYFIDGMNYGGRTDLIYDENFNKYCVIYFNAITFIKTLSEWIEYRDNSIFIETDESNKFIIDYSSEFRGFLHTLIHETCHVYDYMNNVTFFSDSEEKSLFTQNWDSFYIPQKKYQNQKIMKFEFYNLGKKINVKSAKGLLRYLKSTPFSSLYGAKNMADDFAETVTYYILYKELRLDYKEYFIMNGIIKESYSWLENINIENTYTKCSLIIGK